MAEASAINQVAALGESATGLTEVFQQAMGQMTEFVNQAIPLANKSRPFYHCLGG